MFQLYLPSGTDSGWANTIRHNHITSTGGMWISYGASNNVISDNTISFCESGIEMVNVGAGNLVVGNILKSVLVKESNGHICGAPGLIVHGG